ncbi:glycine--tRNA ligase subunit beta [Buchnera aphidicola]|uniref:glycine--tRNA ligase subunit beta n=1 Tax=Buchnera aphidicola TaxID=9 RepID=UPI002238DBE5|nr:glycine--tRNA ligase subunit beta [Buchnera aphidicola]MCW5197633.1 glycine--tRNA ligase subunit beta [Buchnera aphidicola (Chaitophorus viminalis)]
MKKKTFLVEINTEDLPAKKLKKISLSFYTKFIEILKKENIIYSKIYWFATSRRIAIQIKNFKYYKKNEYIIQKGPPISIAFNKKGIIQKPALLWMKKFKINNSHIQILKKDKKKWLIYKQKKKYLDYSEKLSEITKKIFYTCSHLHLMKWNDKKYKFIRPIRNIIMLINKKIISKKIFGLIPNRKTQCHYLIKNKNQINVLHAKNYLSTLKNEGKIIADYEVRKSKIQKNILNLAKKNKSYIIINNFLLEEITALVEWPSALIISFKKKFLSLPKEIIIYILENNLKCFPLFKKKKELKSKFICIINTKTNKCNKIISSYQTLISSKLQDINFFFKKDIKNKLSDNKKLLKKVLFYENLGTLEDKTNRLEKIILLLRKKILFNSKNAQRAAFLSKCDIISYMVSEFPDLQGIIGSYYAKNNGEVKEVYHALKEYYLPKYKNDKLPTSNIGIALSITDKLDTLIGMFIIGKIPKGDKDPFALRRISIGIIKIIIFYNISFNLNKLIKKIILIYRIKKNIKKIISKIICFIINRFYFFYKKEKNIKNIVKSIINLNKINLFQVNKKILTMIKFLKSKDSKKILNLNKRITNILKNQDFKNSFIIKPELFQHELEKKLFKKIQHTNKKIKIFNQQTKYKKSIIEIINIHDILEKFFNTIQINHKIKKIQKNRLNILYMIHKTFQKIAIFSYLY